MEHDQADPVVDDEFDVYNDETFGDDGDEFEWPDLDMPQEKFDESIRLLKSGEYINRLGRGNKKNGNVKSEGQTSNEAEDEYEIENEMEESISRLVLDDENDPGSDIKAQRLASSHAYFMPPQVVNKNLNWFMENYVPGESSLLGSSVWSMHPTATAPPPPPAQAAREDDDPFWTEGPPPDVAASSPAASRPPPGLKRGPRVARTLDEVESELFSASDAASVAPPSSVPIPKTPGVTGSRALTVRELEQDITQGGRHSRSEMGGFNSGAVIPNVSGHNQVLSSHVGSPGSRPHFVNRPPPGLIQMHHPGMQMRPMNHFHPVPHGFNPRFPQSRPIHLPPHPQQMMRMRGPIHNMNHFHPRSPRDSCFDAQQFHMINNYYGNFRPPPRAQEPRDRFAGLMRERDKQRLRNIQIIQLQNDHPYKTDYYFQMRLFKKTGNIDCMKKLFPSKDDTLIRSAYEPTRFENALGKLQAVSALAPKRIIDSSNNVGIKAGNKPNVPTHRLQLLFEIERIYAMFLDLKEIYYRIKAGTIGLYAERQKAEALYTKMLDFIVNSPRLKQWLTVSKGRGLLFEFVAFIRVYEMHQTEAFELLGLLLRAIPPSTMTQLKEGNEDYKLYIKIEEMIKTCSTNQIDILLMSIPEKFFHSRLGCTTFFSILQTAAIASVEDERTEFYICKHAWRPDMAGHLQPGYVPPNHLVGFQRIPSLIMELVNAPNDAVAPLLHGRSRLSLKILLELMLMSSVKHARERLHSLHTSMKFSEQIIDPKNKYVTTMSEEKAELCDPVVDFTLPRRPF